MDQESKRSKKLDENGKQVRDCSARKDTLRLLCLEYGPKQRRGFQVMLAEALMMK